MASKKDRALVIQGHLIDTSPLVRVGEAENWWSYDEDADVLVTYFGPSPVSSFAHPVGPRGMYLLIDLERLRVSGIQIEGCSRFLKAAEPLRARASRGRGQSLGTQTAPSWPIDGTAIGVRVCEATFRCAPA